jgi:hypothetical protein
MRFHIEQRHRADVAGKPIPQNDVSLVSFHTLNADDVDGALRLFIRSDGAQLIGEVLKFPGLQAMATVRTTTGVYTLQVSPATGSNPVVR